MDFIKNGLNAFVFENILNISLHFKLLLFNLNNNYILF